MRALRINRRKLINSVIWFLICVIAVVVISLCIGGTVYSMERNSDSPYDKEYNLSIEKLYIREVRDYLDGNGYSNAGVMLTHVTTEDGLDYELDIHHRMISESDTQKIIEYIDGLNLDIPNSSVRVVFSK